MTPVEMDKMGQQALEETLRQLTKLGWNKQTTKEVDMSKSDETKKAVLMLMAVMVFSSWIVLGVLMMLTANTDRIGKPEPKVVNVQLLSGMGR